LEDKLKKFDLVFSNIDVHGRANFSQAGIKNISIFLMPGSLTDLQKRILGRGGVNEAELQSRLETAKQEIARAKEYDYQVVNENGKLIETIKNVAKIIESNIQTVDILTNSVK